MITLRGPGGSGEQARQGAVVDHRRTDHNGRAIGRARRGGIAGGDASRSRMKARSAGGAPSNTRRVPSPGRYGSRWRRWLKPEERRNELLDVGAEFFATRPYDEVLIEDIAAHVGVSRAPLYRSWAWRSTSNDGVIG